LTAEVAEKSREERGCLPFDAFSAASFAIFDQRLLSPLDRSG